MAIKFLLRFPPELHQALKAQAAREHRRSLHEYIIHLLWRAVERDHEHPAQAAD